MEYKLDNMIIFSSYWFASKPQHSDHYNYEHSIIMNTRITVQLKVLNIQK